MSRRKRQDDEAEGTEAEGTDKTPVDADRGPLPARSTDSDIYPGTLPAASSAAQVGEQEDPNAPQWTVSIPGHAHAASVVRAETKEKAVAKYLAQSGMYSTPVAPVAEPVGEEPTE